MSIDIKRSFTFPFADPEWLQKIVIGGLFFFGAFLSNFFISSVLERVFFSQFNINLSQFDKSMFQMSTYSIFNIPILAFVIGYIVQTAHNEIKEEEPRLPNWDSNFFVYFKYGFKLYLINFGYYLAITAIILALLLPAVILFSILNIDYPLSIFGGILGGILGLLFAVISPFITVFYADNFDWKNAFKIKEIINAISKVFPDYFISFAIMTGLWMSWVPLSIALTCTCIGAIVPQFLVLIIHLVTINLFSQVYKQYLLIEHKE